MDARAYAIRDPSMLPTTALAPPPQPGAPPRPAAQSSMQERGRAPAGSAEAPPLTPEQQQQVSLLTPEQQAEFYAALARDYGGAVQAGQSDMNRADAIRGAAGPQGRNSGRVYSAANPLEHLASGIEKYRAKGDYDMAKEIRDSAMTDKDEMIAREMARFGASRPDMLRR